MRTEQAPILDMSQNSNLLERTQNVLQSIQQRAGRIAVSLVLALPGTAIAGASYELTYTEDAYAADASDYPDKDAPCVASGENYGKISGTGKWCTDYQWGYFTKNSAGQITGNNQISSRGFGYRNCTDYAAWRAQQLTGVLVPYGRAMGDAKAWDENAAKAGYTVDNTPEAGDIAVWEGTTSNKYGHVEVVESVNTDGTVNTSGYNKRQDGTYGTQSHIKADHYIDLNGTGKGIDGVNTQTDPNTYAQNTIRKVVQKTDDGTNLVFWAKSDTVFEDSWHAGGDGVHVAALTNQPDIKDIDVQINPDHQRLVYTATGDGHIYETWYYPGQPIHTGVIASGAGAIKEIQKTIGPDGTQQLYVMTDQGIDEYWWRPGGDGIHKNRLYTLRDPVSMVKIPAEPDGTQIVYVADRSYIYETYWKPGSNINVGTVMSIPQADITDIDAVVDPDGKHHVYAGRRRDGIWEAGWYRGQAVATRQIAGGDDIRDVDAFNQGATHQLYAATGGGVFEYYWQDNSPAQGSTLTLQPDVHTIDRSTTADGLPAVYTGANTKVYETWWGTGQVPQTGAIS